MVVDHQTLVSTKFTVCTCIGADAKRLGPPESFAEELKMFTHRTFRLFVLLIKVRVPCRLREHVRRISTVQGT